MQAIQEASGFLVGVEPNGQRRFLGSCFSFRRPELFITAAHCVAAMTPDTLRIALPALGRVDPGLTVVAKDVHPTADLAVLQVKDAPAAVYYSFRNYDWAAGWGEPVQAFGYPEDTDPADKVLPTPRMFVGHVQRFFPFSDLHGAYLAGELNFPSPQGLSGGPVCRTQDQSAVLGVMTANRDAILYRGAFEERNASGEMVAKERDVTRYGIALLLQDLAPWLDEIAV